MEYETLVDIETLRSHLHDPAWVVVDCRHSLANFAAGRAAYEEAHVPGAAFADVERDLSGEKTGSNGRHPLPERRAFAAFLGRIGADERSQIVAYDEGAGMFAARCWMLVRYLGHARVAILDGGFAAWERSGAPFERGPDRRARMARHFPLGTPLDPVVSASDLLADLGSKSLQPVDARAPERYRGETEPIDPVAGHIPGAKNRPYGANYRSDGHLRSAQELRSEFTALGEPERLVHYCGSGISAAANLFAATAAGLPGGRIYAGSWSEWCADPSRPVERG